MYKIELKPSIAKDIRKIPQAFLSKIDEAISKLVEDPLPENPKKLQGYQDYYRLRVGMYRVIYKVGKKIEIITIIKIGHRKEAYKFF